MSAKTIWDGWDRASLGSLHRRYEAISSGNPTHDVILPEDLAVIIENDAACVPDALLRDYLLKALRGELKRRPGRRPVQFSGMVLDAVAEIIAEDAEQIATARRSGTLKHSRGDLSPNEAAADDIAPLFGNICGRSLRNKISTHKKSKQ